MSEIGKLLEATKPFRDEIAKLHASVEHWKKQAGATDAAFLTEEKALEAAELQVGALEKRIHGLACALEDAKGAIIDVDQGEEKDIMKNKAFWEGINDTLFEYYEWFKTIRKSNDSCPKCDGSGKVGMAEGLGMVCPSCHGKKH